MNPQSLQRQYSRGITLVELLVGTGVMLVVLGLAFTIALESRKSTLALTQRQAAIQYSQQVIDRIGAVIRAGIQPAQLSGLTPLAPLSRFTSDSLSMVVLAGPDEGLLQQMTIVEQSAAAATGKNGEQRWIEIKIDSRAETAASTETLSRSEPIARGMINGFTPRLHLAYAAAPAPGVEPEYVEHWNGETWPALVRILIETQFENENIRPVRMQTAVMPALGPPARSDTVATATLAAARLEAQASTQLARQEQGR